MTRPLITMCLIARDEEERIDRCFSSWWKSVDEVVLCDTGSTDNTVGAARAWAAAKGELHKLKVTRFEWVDDFAAARNHADALATGTFLAWCDLDDTIEGMDHLRQLAQDAPDDTAAFFCLYDYARDDHGNCLSELWRERIVRNGAARWTGRLHEHKVFTSGVLLHVPSEHARWVHHRALDDNSSSERNIRILGRWNEEEPDNPRVLSSLGLEYMGRQDWSNAIDVYERYMQCGGEPADRRSQAARYLASAYLASGDPATAKHVALRSLDENWAWADTHLTMSEVAQTVGRPQEGYLHAKTALELGKPHTLLIVNPSQYEVHARAMMALCLAQLGEFDEALRVAGDALARCPTYPLLVDNVALWTRVKARNQAITALVQCSQALVAGGELVKARDILDCAPVSAIDDERIIRQRAAVYQELEVRHRSKLALVDDCPAARFLLDQLKEAA